MSTEIAKHYDFKNVEKRLYEWWEENGWFEPQNQPQNENFDPDIETFVISIPPPNVTGSLHLGHAMFVSLEDLMIRYNRMLGKASLWVPGTDHAGIATQLQVEKLLRSEGTSREEVGREEFLRRTWEWKEKYGGEITNQLRRLGASCDWNRERFTMDEGLSVAVREAFVQLYEKGLIYRGPRLINWSPGLKTAVSDLEVEYSEEPGTLYFFKYPIKGSDDHLPVATTRPETILGDTAVAVHPDDERYQHLIGKTALVPMLDREIPVIADDYVDMEFGTGALKITPGHDPNDYAIGERHNLSIISMMDKQAKINENGGKYQGMDRFEARKQLWADMEVAGMVIETKPHTLNVPRSQRGGEIIEPMISTQWFVKIQGMADAGIKAVRDGEITIVPERFEKVYFNWLENIQDWCISRQLWWGHRIPVWYGPNNTQYCARTEADAYAQAKAEHGDDVTLSQDDDVLDTWFSSGLWPFSTLGWPEKTPDLDYFYPTSVMETGYDILFFWVARMIMSGLAYTDEAPFHTVYLHGLVRDAQGRKMSKTLGNVTDPLDVIDEFGTDALRFTLLTGGTPGNDLNLSLERVKANRNFANKLWNMSRFVIGKLDGLPQDVVFNAPTAADQWILTKAAKTVTDATRLIDNYQFGQAGTIAYDFIWGDYADWYIETAKQQLQDPAKAWTTARTLVSVLDMGLRLMHPYVPYVTEEVWQNLKQASQRVSAALEPQLGWADALIIAKWPEAAHFSERAGDTAESTANADAYEHMVDLVRSIRRARAENGVEPSRKIPAILATGDAALAERLSGLNNALASLAQLDASDVTIAESAAAPEDSISLVVGTTAVYLPMAGLIDVAAETERITKEIANADKQIKRLTGLLNSPFAQKAPEKVVNAEREKLADLQTAKTKLEAQLAALQK